MTIEEPYYTIHEDSDGRFYAATHPSEAMPSCWTGPTRETLEEAAADHGAHAAEAIENYNSED